VWMVVSVFQRMEAHSSVHLARLNELRTLKWELQLLLQWTEKCPCLCVRGQQASTRRAIGEHTVVKHTDLILEAKENEES
jgi:hypothetical protein